MIRISSNKKCDCNSILGNERGVALILTMSMLVILTLLGTMALNSTDTELKITSNFRVASDAFIGAEMAAEYSSQRVVQNSDVFDLSEDDQLPGLLPDGVTVEGGGMSEVVSYIGAMPAGMAETTSTDAYQTNIYRTGPDEEDSGETAYYRINVLANARGRSTARIEELFVHRGGHVY
ncbi:pilus assembly PilX N-terminal domain-containing protein [Desulfuromonas acetoxidans]|uniref:pilus assembly PilX family protein n=1 Tax=Desulfuromonas acetoxidans TaxID=891 RepID=UPI00292EB6AE|nr:pilus assembly PilX N-terminal domain-containing protein [Desulfuromonas acetoxidans]